MCDNCLLAGWGCVIIVYLQAGDVIVLSKWVSTDWLEGRTASMEGMFPSTFVDIIEPLPAAAAGPQAVSDR